MTTLTWRQQAEAAFRSAVDASRRVTGSAEAAQVTALHAALDVAEPLIAAGERERLREMAETRKGELVLHGLLTDALPWTTLIGLIDDIQAEAGDHVA